MRVLLPFLQRIERASDAVRVREVAAVGAGQPRIGLSTPLSKAEHPDSVRDNVVPAYPFPGQPANKAKGHQPEHVLFDRETGRHGDKVHERGLVQVVLNVSLAAVGHGSRVVHDLS